MPQGGTIKFGNTELTAEELQVMYDLFQQVEQSGSEIQASNRGALESCWHKIEQVQHEYVGSGSGS